MSTECVICFDQFDVFRVLKCGHHFCDGCVDRLVKSNKICCPTCRSEHSFPDSLEHYPPPSFAELLPRKYFGRLICTGCRNEKSIESEFVWCHECFQSLCGMCFLTTHNKRHTFSKWTDGYPAIANCVAFFRQKLNEINKFEDDTLTKYFDDLRSSVVDQVISVSKDDKKMLNEVVSVLCDEFPSAVTIESTTMKDVDVAYALADVEKITQINSNVETTGFHLVTTEFLDNALGLHRHFNVAALVECFVKPKDAYDLSSPTEDFTVIDDEIVLVSRMKIGQFVLSKLNSKWRFPLLQAPVYSEIHVGRFGSDAWVLLNDAKTTNCYVIDVPRSCLKKNLTPVYEGKLCFVESQRELYASAKGRIFTDVVRPVGDNVIRVNNMTQMQTLTFAVEKKDIVQFLSVDFGNEINFICRDKTTHEVFEQRKISFDYLLRKFDLLSDVQLQQKKRITAICGLDDGYVEDFVVVAMEFYSSGVVANGALPIKADSSSTLFLYDVRCDTVHFLQSFPDLVFKKILVRKKLLYCLMDLSDDAKLKHGLLRSIFTFRLL